MESENDGNVQITLNYLGGDYTVLTDLQTANILLNDPEEANAYMQQFVNDYQHHQPSTSNACDTQTTDGAKIIWSGKKSTDRDNRATECFLSLREKYSHKFNDKKTIKSQLWLKIAEEMNVKGYCVGGGKEAIEKCRLKFANLQKQYLNHVRHMKTTGERHKDPPPFFELMHTILGGKDKVDPANTQDSLDETGGESSNDDLSKSQTKNRFNSENKSVKPKSANSQLMNLLQEQFESDKKERQEHFKSIENLFKTQNEQRDRLLNQFERYMDIKSRKRNRSDSE